MLTRKNLTIVGIVVVVFVVLQGILLTVGKADNPVTVAVDFTKAYFMLDGASMSKLLCSEIAEDEEDDVVGTYLYSVAVQAKAMGFPQDYMRNQLGHISTEIQMIDEDTAEVKVTGERLRCINPVYALVGRLFFLIKPHKFDETLNVVKEEGNWKVCGKPFSLSEL